MAKNVKDYIKMAEDLSIPNITVRKEIDEIPYDAFNEEERESILKAVHDNRYEFYKAWQLEVASKYM